MGDESLAEHLEMHMVRVRRRVTVDAITSALLGGGATALAMYNDFTILGLIAAGLTGATIYGCFARLVVAGLGCRTRYWAHELHVFYSECVRVFQEKHGMPLEEVLPEITDVPGITPKG